ncbi:MAG: UDP-2,3-diacylglucosamine diphosphatase [Thiotrichales bacterium]|nr:UDP-2,3-diacylglucosamine diphosphatase [Thiotrichales bacterium]
MQTLFISDLHLCESRPEKIELFEKLLAGIAGNTRALYILGDLFEFWHGDDDLSGMNRSILSALSGLTGKGIPVYLQKGNRDFLAGNEFARRTGVTLLPDYHLIELYGRKVLLMHGDLLCSDDIRYLRMRRLFNQHWLQWLFVHTPMAFRKAIARRVRGLSQGENRVKPADIMDVNQATVEQTMQAHGVLELIHGHTHRPAIHELVLDGKKARRIVLGDWYAADSVLLYTQDKQELLPVSDLLNRF